MAIEEHGIKRFQLGKTLEWSEEARQHENFSKYVALIGQGPFTDYEVLSVSAKSTVYGDERFRDGMRVPEKLLSIEARENEARQVGDVQRIKIHQVDAQGHHLSFEFPAYFFQAK
jgi:hypothetical protein